MNEMKENLPMEAFVCKWASNSNIKHVNAWLVETLCLIAEQT